MFTAENWIHICIPFSQFQSDNNANVRNILYTTQEGIPDGFVTNILKCKMLVDVDFSISYIISDIRR